MEIVVPLFRDEYQLIVNAEKTKVGHLDMDVELLFEQSAWRGTRKSRKLGSLQYCVYIYIYIYIYKTGS